MTHDLAGFMAAFSGQCEGCLVGDAAFVDAEGYADLSLAPESPARDGGGPTDVATVFETLYGLSIAVAIDNTPRPVGAGPDMGCFEQ